MDMVSIMWKSGPRRPVVVTGAAGFVGGHVARALCADERQVVATDRTSELPSRVTRGLPNSVSYVGGDLREDRTLERILTVVDGPLDVVHAAAVTQFAQLGRALGEGAPTPAEAFASFDINAVATWRLVTRLAQAGRLGRLLYISTRSVFGGRADGSTAIPEDATPMPASIYGASKAAAEVGLLSLREAFDLDAVLVRITGAFGPWQGPVSWLGQAVDHALLGKPYRVPSGHDDAYELTYVKDTTRGLVSLLDVERLRSPVYHVSSGEMVTLGRVAEAVRSARPDVDMEFGRSSALGGALRAALSGAKLREETGFEPTWTLEEAVADYLRAEETDTYGAEVVLAGGS